jgi:ribosomal protein S18 acetylase RimI-like enzyme
MSVAHSRAIGPTENQARTDRAVGCDRGMAIVLGTPGVDGLGTAVDALREWQFDGAPMQLHPGDLGWFWRFGAEATAAAVRTWSRDGRILAVGLLDGPDLLRLTIAPDARRDAELARQLVEDVTAPDRGVVGEGKVNVEAPLGALVKDLLSEAGWPADEPWTPLRRDLAEPVQDPGVRIEVIGPDRAHVRATVQRASFDTSTFTDERWHAMAAGLPYADARCLVAYDDHGDAVAAVTVWSSGPGKPGLLEPMGVHRQHRGRGHGRAITLAAAAALRELGSSSAIVCTPSANVGGVAAYRSAGFRQLPEVHDQYRAARGSAC